MTTRIGIELSPVACRLVELDLKRAWNREDSDTRVLSFATWQADTYGSMGAPETARQLAGFRGRQVAVVLWGPRASYQAVEVVSGPYDRMRLEAAAHLRAAGRPMDSSLFDIAPFMPMAADPDRRLVLAAAAPTAEVSAALAPLVSAGLKVRSVLTPAAALQALAHLRAMTLAAETAATTEACIALEETATCLAIVRGGNLVAARDLAWGFLDEFANFQIPRERADIAGRLADDLGAFLASIGLARRALSYVWIMGGLPELRSMAATLTGLIDVEVEALDSLFNIEEDRLPEPGDQFRERAAELRLAWAAAAHRQPALDLFRERRRRRASAQLSRAAVVAGTAAGLGVGWLVQKELPPVEVVRAATAQPARIIVDPGAGEPRSLVSRLTVPPDAMLVAGAVPPVFPSPAAPDGAVDSAVGSRLAGDPADGVDPVISSQRRPWENVPPVLPRVVAMAASLPPSVASAAPRATVPRAEVPRPDRPRQTEVSAPLGPSLAPPQAPRPAAAEAPLPFDGALETILYGRDRTLAIIDGRIIEPGDEVRGARVVEITASAVLLRDSQGRLRKLSLGAKGR